MSPLKSPMSRDSSFIVKEVDNAPDKPATVGEEDQQVWDMIAKQDEERRLNDRAFLQRLGSQPNSRDITPKTGLVDLTTRTESPPPRMSKRCVPKRRISLDILDDPPDLANAPSSGSAEPPRRVRRRLKLAKPAPMERVCPEKDDKNAEPTPTSTSNPAATNTEDISPKKEAVPANVKISETNLRVQISLAAIQPCLGTLGGTKVTAQEQARRMNALVDLLCAVDEAGSDIHQVRKVLLRTMQQYRNDPPFQNSIFDAFAVCLGPRDQSD